MVLTFLLLFSSASFSCDACSMANANACCFLFSMLQSLLCFRASSHCCCSSLSIFSDFSFSFKLPSFSCCCFYSHFLIGCFFYIRSEILDTICHAVQYLPLFFHRDTEGLHPSRTAFLCVLSIFSENFDDHNHPSLLATLLFTVELFQTLLLLHVYDFLFFYQLRLWVMVISKLSLLLSCPMPTDPLFSQRH